MTIISRLSNFVPELNVHIYFPGGASGKYPTCQCRRHKRCGFDSCVRKILWRRKWKPTPEFLSEKPPWTEEPGGLQSIGLQRIWHNWSQLALYCATFQTLLYCIVHDCCCYLCYLVDKWFPTFLQPHGLWPARLLCPWGFPGKNIGVGCLFLLQGIFLTQGSNSHLLHWQEDSLSLSHLGSPFVTFYFLN